MCVYVSSFHYVSLYSDYDTNKIYICDTFCFIDDNKLSDCTLSPCGDEDQCTEGVVGITCSKWLNNYIRYCNMWSCDLTGNSLSTAVIIVIVASVLVAVVTIASGILCHFCPFCPCYNVCSCCCDCPSSSTNTDSRTPYAGVTGAFIFVFSGGRQGKLFIFTGYQTIPEAPPRSNFCCCNCE